jgi:hypothetical protein
MKSFRRHTMGLFDSDFRVEKLIRLGAPPFPCCLKVLIFSYLDQSFKRGLASWHEGPVDGHRMITF